MKLINKIKRGILVKAISENPDKLLLKGGVKELYGVILLRKRNKDSKYDLYGIWDSSVAHVLKVYQDKGQELVTLKHLQENSDTVLAVNVDSQGKRGGIIRIELLSKTEQLLAKVQQKIINNSEG